MLGAADFWLNGWGITPTITDSISAIPDLSARWRADQITGVSSGAAVTSWPDASGHGYAATQGSALSQPTYQAASVGGQPAVRFTASAPSYLTAAAPAGDPAQTVVAVVRLPAIGGTYTIRGGEDGGNGNGALQFRVEGSGALGLVQQNIAYLGSSTTTISTTAVAVAATFGDSSDGYAFYVNGAAAGSGTTTATLTTPIGTRLGMNAGSGEAFDGDIAEVIAWNRVLTSTELATVQTYVAARYLSVTASAAGSVTLGGSATATVPATASGSVSLSGSSAATAPAATSGSVTLAGSGNARAAASATGSISLGGTGTVSASPSAVGAVALTGTGTAQARATGAGVVTLGGAGTVSATATAAGVLALGGTAAPQAGTAASSVVTLSATATAAAVGAATGALTLSGTPSPIAVATAVGTVTLGGTATGTGPGSRATGTITLTGTATAAATSAASGSIVLVAATATAMAGAMTSGTVALSGTGATRVTAVASGSITVTGTSSPTATAAATGGVVLVSAAQLAALGNAAGAIELDGLATGRVGAPPRDITVTVGALAGRTLTAIGATRRLSTADAPTSRATTVGALQARTAAAIPTARTLTVGTLEA